jgi:hypothetical protein
MRDGILCLGATQLGVGLMPFHSDFEPVNRLVAME